MTGPVSDTAAGQAIPVSAGGGVVDVRDVNRALTDEEMQNYVGDAACAGCHRQAAATHARSSHAHTFHLVPTAQDTAFFRASKTVTDSHINYAYQTRAEGGKCLMIGKNAQGQGSIAAAYAMGTGRTGITYLGQDKNSQWLEMRLSYFPKAHTWDFTPGQGEGKDVARAAGNELSPRDFQMCLGCHGTAIRATPDGADVGRSLMNVGCERCHGPGRAHILQAAQALASRVNTAPVPPAAKAASTANAITAMNAANADVSNVSKDVSTHKYSGHATYGMEDLHQATPARITTICGGCHRAESAEHPLSVREEPKLARFQGVALARSACYRQSGTLSCVTCHDAHTNADPSLSRNDAICLRCHSGQEAEGETRRRGDKEKADIAQGASTRGVAGKVCPVNAHTGCTNCHMPKTAGIMPHSLFTNHLIKVWPSPASAGAGNAHTNLQ